MKRTLLTVSTALTRILAVGCLAIATPGADEPQPLTLAQAHDLALQSEPSIQMAALRALAAEQITREAQATYYPSIVGVATAARTAHNATDNTRLAAGGINNPIIFNREAYGVNVSLLITDFGRTSNLSDSAQFHAQAEHENARFTQDQILLQVDLAYFRALQSQSTLQVAEDTIKSRQLLVDQVAQLVANNLKSDLDASFAQVNLGEAKLLLANTQNTLQTHLTELSTLLGFPTRRFRLSEEPLPPILPDNTSELLKEAYHSNPELTRLRLEREAAQSFARAERRLDYPVVSAVGAFGEIPEHDVHLRDDYAAGAINLSVPLFSGFLYSARQSEAELRARMAEENLRGAENNLVKNVQIAFDGCRYALQRLSLTEEYLRYSSQALSLAQTRFNLGATSIVELSQAQLANTQASIAFSGAKYEYLIYRAILSSRIGKR